MEGLFRRDGALLARLGSNAAKLIKSLLLDVSYHVRRGLSLGRKRTICRTPFPYHLVRSTRPILLIYENCRPDLTPYCGRSNASWTAVTLYSAGLPSTVLICPST